MEDNHFFWCVQRRIVVFGFIMFASYVLPWTFPCILSLTCLSDICYTELGFFIYFGLTCFSNICYIEFDYLSSPITINMVNYQIQMPCQTLVVLDLIDCQIKKLWVWYFYHTRITFDLIDKLLNLPVCYFFREITF